MNPKEKPKNIKQTKSKNKQKAPKVQEKH